MDDNVLVPREAVKQLFIKTDISVSTDLADTFRAALEAKPQKLVGLFSEVTVQSNGTRELHGFLYDGVELNPHTPLYANQIAQESK